MSLKVYTPEMGEIKPKADIEARRSYNGKHFYLDTPLELPTSRSVELLQTYKVEDLVKGSHKVGWNCYRVTKKAFEAICQKYNVSFEALLD